MSVPSVGPSVGPLVGLATGRRLTALLVTLTLLGAPALALRAFCVGRSCEDPVSTVAAPFCPLPADLRTLVAAGFRQGRSPDVMAVSGGRPVATWAAGSSAAWPAASTERAPVPIAFLGDGVAPGSLPVGIGLMDVAPTLAALLGYTPPHPEVRAGRAVEGVTGRGSSPLAVEIVWKGLGSADLGEGWPGGIAPLVRAGGATLDGDVGSLPIDPAAVLTTIGTGGTPAQHGITGTRLRSKAGGVARAWSPRAPEAVITSLPDDLDRSFGERSRVGLVATDPTDRGLIGDGWYLGADRDRMMVASGDPITAVARMIDSGYGTDGVPDILGVVLRGPVHVVDRRTLAIVRAVTDRVPRAVFAIAATGSAAKPEGAVLGADVAEQVDDALGERVTKADAAGGVFLDAAALARAGRSSDAVVEAMQGQTDPGGAARFADVFPAFSVAFARYC